MPAHAPTRPASSARGAARRDRAGERLARWARGLPARNGGWVGLAALAVILALALGLRLDAALDPLGAGEAGVDAAQYERLAEHLYEEGEYGLPGARSPLDWSPGSVFLYAGVYAVTGGVNPGAARVAVALLGVLTALLVYLIGRRLGAAAAPERRRSGDDGAPSGEDGALPPAGRVLDPGPLAGLVGALLVATYPTYLDNTARLMSEPPAIAALAGTVLAFLWAGDRRSTWAWALPGVLLGLTAFARPEYLLFGVVLGLLALWRAGRDRAWRLGAAAALVFVVAFLIPLAPWTVRNAIVEDRFIPVSTGGGKALFVGTYLPGDGLYINVKRDLIHRYYGLEGLTRAGVERVNPTPLFDRVAARHPELEPDAALARVGREQLRRYLREDPLGMVGMWIYKMGYMWQEATDGLRTPPAVKVLHFSILALGLLGLVIAALRRRWEAVVIGSLIVGITILGGLLLAGVRRNLMLMPFAMALAGLAVSTAVTWARSRRAPTPGTAEGDR